MTEVDGINSISGAVDVRAAVVESRLESHSRRETLAGSGGMVRAPVSALGVNSRELGVLFIISLRITCFEAKTYSSDNLLEEGSESSIDVVGENANDFGGTGLNVASHVLVEHGLDLATVLLVLLEDSTTSDAVVTKYGRCDDCCRSFAASFEGRSRMGRSFCGLMTSVLSESLNSKATAEEMLLTAQSTQFCRSCSALLNASTTLMSAYSY